MAQGSQLNEVVCSGCLRHQERLLIPTCQVHKFCTGCILHCIRTRMCCQTHLGLECPLSIFCESNMDKELLKDILHPLQTVDLDAGSLLLAYVDALAEPENRNACPKKNCTHSFVNENGPWAKLFKTCPNCNEEICTTCRESLGPDGHKSHVCGSKDRTLLQLLKRELPEILSQCVLPYCPNKNCKFFTDPKAAAPPQGNCNAIQCSECNGYYCYICSKDLKTDRRFEALKKFSHKNQAWPDGPECWPYNERHDLEKTESRARHLRKLQGVKNVLKRLPESRREVYLEECRELLGSELYLELKVSSAKRLSCVVM